MSAGSRSTHAAQQQSNREKKRASGVAKGCISSQGRFLHSPVLLSIVVSSCRLEASSPAVPHVHPLHSVPLVTWAESIQRRDSNSSSAAPPPPALCPSLCSSSPAIRPEV